VKIRVIFGALILLLAFQTIQAATAFTGSNIISARLVDDGDYCAGCNGSFLLDFATTDWELPLAAPIDFYSIPTPFRGIISDQVIKSIHVGLENGGISTPSTFRMNDPTTGSINPIPIPAALHLFGTTLIGLAGLSKRRKMT